MGAICGLVDFAGAPADAEGLRAMTEAAAYRGPEGIGYLQAGEAALAHLALDRTPESAGVSQPIKSRDGRVCLTADARIDNREELLPRLAGSIPKAVPSDAELILAAYLRWGTRCVEHLLGDFVFALWDAPERRFFCARDPLGVKLVHYARRGDLLLVASEAQQILSFPSFPRRLDGATVGEFLIDVVRTSDRTFFHGVQRLMPGHRLTATAGGVRVERYWDVDPEHRVRHRNADDYAQHFRELFERAVAARLRTRDQAVGVSMSGGLDSTSVTAVAHRLAERGGSPRIVAASYVFGHLPDCDESPYIRAMGRELGVEVQEIDAERFWILGDPEAYEPRAETPLLNWDGVHRQVCRRLKQRGARVVLGGLGGDNLHLGSPQAWLDRWRRGDVGVLADVARHAWALRGRPLWLAMRQYLWRRPATRVRSRLSGTIAPFTPEWIAPGLRARVEALEGDKPAPRFTEAARQQLYRNIVLLGLDGRATDWLERCSSRWGVEARHPHLDRRLVELVLAIPQGQLYHPPWFKPLLRRAMRGVLPETVRQRRDKSNLAGFVHWSLRHKEGERIAELLESPLSAEMGFVDGDRLRAAFDRYRREFRLEAAVSQLWLAVNFEIWLRKFHSRWESEEWGLERPIISSRRDARHDVPA